MDLEGPLYIIISYGDHTQITEILWVSFSTSVNEDIIL